MDKTLMMYNNLIINDWEINTILHFQNPYSILMDNDIIYDDIYINLHLYL